MLTLPVTGKEQQPEASTNVESRECSNAGFGISLRMGVCPYKGQPSGPPLAAACTQEMVKNRATHLEGRDRATRQEQRRALGPLRNLTVQPATRARYDKALEKFRDYLRSEGRRFPDDPQVLDFWLSHYIEVLWESGEGRALAADTIASIQDFRPAVKGRLSSSWRLMKTWSTTELPNRAPPLPQEALDILVGYSLFRDDPLFALSLLLGFHGLLRTGELLGVKKQHIEQAGPRSVAILSLGITKGSRRQGAAESVTIREEDTLRRLWQWRQTPSSRTNLCEAPHVWRKKFGEFVSHWFGRPPFPSLQSEKGRRNLLFREARLFR